MKPWREIAVPHRDVLEGTFQQSEFAADITAVHTGKATREYQDAVAFFERTFITEGMRLLLTQVAQRLAAKAASRSSSFRPLSAAARRIRCSPSIILRRASVRSSELRGHSRSVLDQAG